MGKIFGQHELKTIEVDVDKKIFRINGEDFGNDCLSFSIWCDPGKWNITARLTSEISFASYDSDGKMKGFHSIERNS